MEIKALQKKQAEYDAEYFHRNTEFEKIRHVFLHLVSSVGKLSSYCEEVEHTEKEYTPTAMTDEVVPDLLMHIAQIANYYNIDLEVAYMARLENNIKEFSKNN